MSSNTKYKSLSDYVASTLNDWYNNRLRIQHKWERNYRLYNGLDIDVWKRHEADHTSSHGFNEGYGSVTTKENEEEERNWRSRTFIKALKQKTVSAFSQVVDIVLQNGRMPYALKTKGELEYSPTPQPPAQIAPEIQQKIQQLPPDQQQMAMALVQEQMQKVAKKDLEGKMEKSRIAMEKRIGDQLTESKANIEMAKSCLSLPLYGESILKKIIKLVPKKAYKNEVTDDGTEVSIVVHKTKKVPGIVHVPVWDIFRDLEADDIQDGKGIIHRTLWEPYDLWLKLDNPNYIKENVQEAIDKYKDSGDSECFKDYHYITDINSYQPKFRRINQKENILHYVEYWGRVPKELALQFEAEIDEKSEKSYEIILRNSKKVDELATSGNEVEVVLGMIGDIIISYERTRAEDRPFMRAVWEWNPDEPYGIGVADNTEDDQILLNGATRAFEDNKKLSSNIGFAVRTDKVGKLPKDLTPGFRIQVDEDEDIRRAFMPLTIPDVGESLMSVINLASRFMEEDSLIPRITQGMAENVPGTAFAAAQQIDKAGKYMAAVIQNIDSGQIEPTISWYYEFNMRDPEVKAKSDLVVVPEGFKVYKERIQALSQFNSYVSFVMNNPLSASQIDIRKTIEEYGRILDIDYTYLLKPIEQVTEEAQAQAKQQQALAAAGAQKERVELENKMADTLKKQTDAKKNLNDIKVDNAETISQIEKNKNDMAVTTEEMIQKRQKEQAILTPRAPTVPSLQQMLERDVG